MLCILRHGGQHPVGLVKVPHYRGMVLQHRDQKLEAETQHLHKLDN